MRLHVSLEFAEATDTALDNFTVGVSSKLYGNAAYTASPVAQATLDAGNVDFTEKVALAKLGGPADTAAKNQSRQILLGLLYAIANYVEGACNNDLATLLSSGFAAASQERRREPLHKPVLSVKNGDLGGQIIGKVSPPVKNTRLYEGRARDKNGVYLPSVFSGDSRHVIFIDLVPGDLYTFEVRALGGSTGSSDWSDAVQHRSL